MPLRRSLLKRVEDLEARIKAQERNSKMDLFLVTHHSGPGLAHEQRDDHR